MDDVPGGDLELEPDGVGVDGNCGLFRARVDGNTIVGEGFASVVLT